jgi:hypothetical protein
VATEAAIAKNLVRDTDLILKEKRIKKISTQKFSVFKKTWTLVDN